MIHEEAREERRTRSPAPQLPKLAPPVHRAGTPAGSPGSAAGVEADSIWDDVNLNPPMVMDGFAL
ncbi:hypothetical protein BX285_6908 [Streptomyces sp. 1114.5]|uniref:hypothetical protein n=1 Tax=Streptomyces sp. 1114.5 TaxID=1938830 RepID=UPI000EAC1C7D|nr:hypothetical protein [Streptomyces sp. 1114.5]RKT09802.1 hypothetical protein BX285_6908 [Streptomyces sp. 1114.5]